MIHIISYIEFKFSMNAIALEVNKIFHGFSINHKFTQESLLKVVECLASTISIPQIPLANIIKPVFSFIDKSGTGSLTLDELLDSVINWLKITDTYTIYQDKLNYTETLTPFEKSNIHIIIMHMFICTRETH